MKIMQLRFRLISLIAATIVAGSCLALNFRERVLSNSEFHGIVGHDIIEVRYGFPVWAYRKWPLIFVGRTEWNPIGVAVDVLVIFTAGAVALLVCECAVLRKNSSRGGAGDEGTVE